MKNNRLLKSVGIASTLLVASLLPAKAFACGGNEPFIGQICQVGFNFAPRSYAFTDGQLLPIAQNTALFSLLGTSFGGDGRTTFGLPDLRGRTMVHPGHGPGLSPVTWGQKWGAETVTLNQNHLPSHTHTAQTTVTNTVDTSGSTVTIRAVSSNANQTDPSGNALANGRRTNMYSADTPDVDLNADAGLLTLSIGVDSTATTTVSNTGGSQSFSVRDPSLGVYHVIALYGIFPSRN